MEEVTNLSYESIVRYFSTLRQFGYKRQDDVDKLLALVGIEEMLASFQDFITEKDLDTIMKAINCLSGTTCLIDFIPHSQGSPMTHKTNVCYLTKLSRIDSVEPGGDLLRIM